MTDYRQGLRRMLLCGCILAAGIGAAVSGPGQSLAAASSVKLNGPNFTISNLHMVQTTTTVTDAQSNIKSLQIGVHGPSGTKLSRVHFGHAWAKSLPKVSYYADQATGTYVVTVAVSTVTSTSANAVSAQIVLLNQSTGAHITVTLNGTENKTLTTTMKG